jgi:hypothetical protein
MEESENGGYPDVLTDKNGKRWVFWESSGWDVLSGQTQTIKVSWFDSPGKQWAIPSVITVDSMAYMNQTPDAALDRQGRIWLVWSGRPKGDGRQWGIYLSFFNGTLWSLPRQITNELLQARAPKISIGKNDAIHITYHSGKGREMKIEVLHLNRQQLPD